MVMMIGFFGWTGAPLVFANFSRALIEVLRNDNRVVGVVHIFCDDFMGLSHRNTARNDQLIARDLVEGVALWRGISCPCKGDRSMFES